LPLVRIVLNRPRMMWLRRLGGLGLMALVGCGGAAFTTDTTDGGLEQPDGSGGDDGGIATDAGDASPALDGSPAHDAGSDAGSCVAATITFSMQAAAGSGKSYCIGGNALSCATDWLSLRSADTGAALTIDAPCITQCNACQPVACSLVCAAPSQLPPAGAKRAWDGTVYLSGTCGAAGATACVTPSCVAPGRYVAKMCGFAKVGPDAGTVGPCSGATTATCVEVPFDWPPANGATVVTGTLG
jgi:hypothetical protein